MLSKPFWKMEAKYKFSFTELAVCGHKEQQNGNTHP